uniref:Protein ENHANCED DISEASE RESISTANCE 2 C-terminal domain-containing protein n=1 Tax=Trieres chinensis TaxID=1514140 RepID=A0A7S1YWI4_TRICV|mmetsp:Transcript_12453/g.25870  ORF Transcript_12453/g.25870 Transcript_12453/m.25870 type:complete len:579 (+) Transcript_12453:72-1808(+)
MGSLELEVTSKKEKKKKSILKKLNAPTSTKREVSFTDAAPEAHAPAEEAYAEGHDDSVDGKENAEWAELLEKRRALDKQSERVLLMPKELMVVFDDSTILATIGFAALSLTVKNWSAAFSEVRPTLYVTAAWVFFGYLFGEKKALNSEYVELEIEKARKEAKEEAEEEARGKERRSLLAAVEGQVVLPYEQIREDGRLTDSTLDIIAATVEAAGDQAVGNRASLREGSGQSLAPEGKRDKRHSLMKSLVMRLADKEFSFNSLDDGATNDNPLLQDLPEGFWSNLIEAKKKIRNIWEDSYGIIGTKLIGRISKNPNFRKQMDGKGDETTPPMLALRAVDVFQSEEEEDRIATRPILSRCGLRDVPTMVINIVTPHCNFVVYLEMPIWASDLEAIEECKDGSDSKEMLALKRFLNGSDEYRNKRFKIYPDLVSGPVAARMIFHPPTREHTIWGTMLPISWSSGHEIPASEGQKKRYGYLEATVDVSGNEIARKVSKLMLSCMDSMCLDFALAIGTPDGQDEKEPEALLGMLRFDRIDVSTCPILPPMSDRARLGQANEVMESLANLSKAQQQPAASAEEG